jgi:hypothetical protein
VFLGVSQQGEFKNTTTTFFKNIHLGSSLIKNKLAFFSLRSPPIKKNRRNVLAAAKKSTSLTHVAFLFFFTAPLGSCSQGACCCRPACPLSPRGIGASRPSFDGPGCSGRTAGISPAVPERGSLVVQQAVPRPSQAAVLSRASNRTLEFLAANKRNGNI